MPRPLHTVAAVLVVTVYMVCVCAAAIPPDVALYGHRGPNDATYAVSATNSMVRLVPGEDNALASASSPAYDVPFSPSDSKPCPVDVAMIFHAAAADGRSLTPAEAADAPETFVLAAPVVTASTSVQERVLGSPIEFHFRLNDGSDVDQVTLADAISGNVTVVAMVHCIEATDLGSVMTVSTSMAFVRSSPSASLPPATLTLYTKYNCIPSYTVCADLNFCSGHGACVANNSAAVACLCPSPYSGPTCRSTLTLVPAPEFPPISPFSSSAFSRAGGVQSSLAAVPDLATVDAAAAVPRTAVFAPTSTLTGRTNSVAMCGGLVGTDVFFDWVDMANNGIDLYAGAWVTDYIDPSLPPLFALANPPTITPTTVVQHGPANVTLPPPPVTNYGVRTLSGALFEIATFNIPTNVYRTDVPPLPGTYEVYLGIFISAPLAILTRTQVMHITVLPPDSPPCVLPAVSLASADPVVASASVTLTKLVAPTGETAWCAAIDARGSCDGWDVHPTSLAVGYVASTLFTGSLADFSAALRLHSAPFDIPAAPSFTDILGPAMALVSNGTIPVTSSVEAGWSTHVVPTAGPLVWSFTPPGGPSHLTSAWRPPACSPGFFGIICNAGCSVDPAAPIDVVSTPESWHSGGSLEWQAGSSPALRSSTCYWRISVDAASTGINVILHYLGVEDDLDSLAILTDDAARSPIITYSQSRQIPTEPTAIPGVTSVLIALTNGASTPSGSFVLTWRPSGCPSGSSHVDTLVPGATTPFGPFTRFVSSCTACPPGSASVTADAAACGTCNPGSFAPTPGTLSCAACPTGTYAPDPGAAVCLPCANGTFATTAGAVSCAPCEAGTIAPRPGLALCTRCPLTSYAPGEGRSECLACPPFTASPFLGAAFLSDCRCLPGYYHPNGTTGARCVPCPRGAICAGGTAAPISAPGSWAAPANPFVFRKCGLAEACVSGPPGSCAHGHTGALCADCADGFFTSGSGKCERCASSHAAALPLAISASLIVLYVLYKATNMHDDDALKATIGLGTSFGLFVSYAQFAALFRTFKISWPHSVDFVLSFFSVFALDFKLFAPECSIPLSYQASITFRLLLPLCIAGVFVLAHLLHPLYRYFVAHVTGPALLPRATAHARAIRTIRLAIAGGSDLPASPPLYRRATWVVKTWVFNALTRSTPMLWSRSFNAFLAIVDILYVYLAFTSFEVFNCFEQYDGSYSLNADPSITCYTSPEWRAALVPSILAIVAYVVLYPLALCRAYLVARPFILSHVPDRVWNRYSSLLYRYRRQARWWLLATALRKVAVALAAAVFGNAPSLQAFGSILILTIALAAQLTYRPFLWSRHNTLESRLLFLNISLLLFGTVFFIDEVDDATRTGLSAATIVTVLAGLVSLISVVVLDSYEYFMERTAPEAQLVSNMLDSPGTFDFGRVAAAALARRSVLIARPPGSADVSMSRFLALCRIQGADVENVKAQAAAEKLINEVMEPGSAPCAALCSRRSRKNDSYIAPTFALGVADHSSLIALGSDMTLFTIPAVDLAYEVTSQTMLGRAALTGTLLRLLSHNSPVRLVSFLRLADDDMVRRVQSVAMANADTLVNAYAVYRTTILTASSRTNNTTSEFVLTNSGATNYAALVANSGAMSEPDHTIQSFSFARGSDPSSELDGGLSSSSSSSSSCVSGSASRPASGSSSASSSVSAPPPPGDEAADVPLFALSSPAAAPVV